MLKIAPNLNYLTHTKKEIRTQIHALALADDLNRFYLRQILLPNFHNLKKKVKLLSCFFTNIL